MIIINRTSTQSLFLLVVFSACLVSCKKDLYTPDCGAYSYGYIELINSTGYEAWVDVTWGDMEINDRRKMDIGADTMYRQVPSGFVGIWVSLDSIDWIVDMIGLLDCEELKYTMD